ncbi:MAG: L-threonine 3-dehydrogenase [Trueperaceae bacterium]|nr:L-threonine 3-dehydrogenase [Trueperaceae bacterium]
MKALAKSEPRPGLWRIDAPEPEPGPRDLLLDVTHTSICGTDLHIYDWDDWARRTVPVPMIIGHEYVGVVREVGAEVQGFAVGDRVAGEGHLTCGHCRNCRAGRRHLCRNTRGVGVNVPGAFAERFVLPAGNAFRVPPGIPDAWAALLDPFGNAVHTALTFDLVGEDVLITGAGPIGVMAAAVARFAGARFIVITDVAADRLALAERMGVVDKAVDVSGDAPDLREVMGELGMTEGFDVALEMSGAAAAFEDILGSINHGGRVALLGIPSAPIAIDWNRVIFKGLTLRGIYGRRMFETWYKTANLLQSGVDLAPVITHQLPADAFEEGFDAMRTGRAGKVILDWT